MLVRTGTTAGRGRGSNSAAAMVASKQPAKAISAMVIAGSWFSVSSTAGESG